MDGKDTKSTAEIGEFEVDFLYGGDSINAQVDLNYRSEARDYDHGKGGVDLEQAFVGFSVSDQFSLKAGKFLSSIGYEPFRRERPVPILGMQRVRQEFIRATTPALAGVYSGDAFGVYASAVADTWDSERHRS